MSEDTKVAYTIKLGNGKYVSCTTQPLRKGWSPKFITVDDVDDARHYKHKAQAANYMKRLLINVNKMIEAAAGKNVAGISSYYARYYNNKIGEIKGWQSQIEGASVERIEVYEPNFFADMKKRQSFRIIGAVCKTSTDAVNRKGQACKLCGIELKNIPTVHIKGEWGHTHARYCMFCAKELGGIAKGLEDEMGEEKVTELRNGLFLAKL